MSPLLTSAAALALRLVALGARCGAQPATFLPDQFFYNSSTLSSSRTAPGGCTIRDWIGSDPAGVAGPPWISTIDCPDGCSHTDSGVATLGPLQFFLRHGTAMFDGETHSSMGDAFWLGSGAYLDLYVGPSSFVYVTGGAFKLAPWRSRRSVVSSSYRAPRRRSYKVADAIAGRQSGALVHDEHIANGSSTSVDLIFSKGKSMVDPPVITVVNCAFDLDRSLSFVWYHLHPAGAVYLPYTGSICYVTDEERCSAPGWPRWVSPNLFYYETFYARDSEPSAEAAAALVGQALVNATERDNCTHPIIFGVTNFDPDDPAGQPNFDDQPAGPAKWGAFDTMTIRTTTISTNTVTVTRANLRGAASPA